jgi:hypothetical protein
LIGQRFSSQGIDFEGAEKYRPRIWMVKFPMNKKTGNLFAQVTRLLFR